MAVIINEMEVILESQSSQREKQTEPASRPVAFSPLKPYELSDILRRQAERALRLRAH